MKFNKAEVISLIIVIISLAVAFYFYPQLPERIASHWNTQGKVDGYMGRFWGVFLMPIISIFLFLIFIAIPRIDPKKENIEKFRKYFDNFIILVFLFLFYIYLLAISWNLGYALNIVQFISPAVAILFYYAGVLITHSEPNWMVGIRTPWTLSSDNVWRKTHALGGKLFRVSAVITLLAIFFPKQGIWFIIIPILAATVFSFIYSYLEYKKEPKK